MSSFFGSLSQNQYCLISPPTLFIGQIGIVNQSLSPLDSSTICLIFFFGNEAVIPGEHEVWTQAQASRAEDDEGVVVIREKPTVNAACSRHHSLTCACSEPDALFRCIRF